MKSSILFTLVVSILLAGISGKSHASLWQIDFSGEITNAGIYAPYGTTVDAKGYIGDRFEGYLTLNDDPAGYNSFAKNYYSSYFNNITSYGLTVGNDWSMSADAPISSYYFAATSTANLFYQAFSGLFDSVASEGEPASFDRTTFLVTTTEMDVIEGYTYNFDFSKGLLDINSSMFTTLYSKLLFNVLLDNGDRMTLHGVIDTFNIANITPLTGEDLSAVPLPAGVWLFGSVLAAFGAVGRWRRVAMT